MKQIGLRTKVRLVIHSEALSNYFGIGGHVLTPDFDIGLEPDRELDRVVIESKHGSRKPIQFEADEDQVSMGRVGLYRA